MDAVLGHILHIVHSEDMYSATNVRTLLLLDGQEEDCATYSHVGPVMALVMFPLCFCGRLRRSFCAIK